MEAFGYGTVYLFFPVGKFKFIWSKEIYDLWSKVDGSGIVFEPTEDDSFYNWNYEYGENAAGEWYYKGRPMGDNNFDSVYDYIIDDLLDGDENEYDERGMEWVPEMSLEDFHTKEFTEFEKNRDYELKQIIKMYGDKDLKGAIQSGHEIMFKCKSYLLIRTQYKDLLTSMIWEGDQRKLPFHLEENTLIPEYIRLIEELQLNEMSSDTFKFVKSLGAKLGVRIKKSESIFSYLKKFGKGADDLVRYASLYLLTDITDSKSRKELVQDAKNTIKKMDRRELMGFVMQIDRATFGVTAHLRHIMQSVFGLEVATYNKWLDDIKYMKKEMRHIRKVLKRTGGSEKELKALNTLEKMILNMESI